MSGHSMNMPYTWRIVLNRPVDKSVHVPSNKLNDSTQCGGRKSETCWPLMEPMVEKKIIVEGRKESRNAYGEKKEMAGEGVSESSSTSSLQLLQVTREAQNVNQMIDVWSKGVDLDDQSRNIAQDLRKSALKLQESLVMLGRLQEASKFMARLKEEAKPKYEEEYRREGVSAHKLGSGQVANDHTPSHRRHSIDASSRTDSFHELKKVLRDGLSDHILSSTRGTSFRKEGLRAEEIGSGRFENHNYEKRLEKKLPLVNDEESNRNCMEEIKKVIKDSLVKQNLLSLSSDEEISPSGRRRYDVLSEVHYSSSCRSFSDAPKSNKKVEQQMKTSKSPNLIAKLMGLEEFPSETGQSTPLGPEIKKSYYQRKPVFDIQMPKVTTAQIVDRTGNQGKKELKEIIDSMRYKGLLRSTQTKEYPLSSRALNTTEELPPIVIIKPLPFSGHEYQEEEGEEDDREKVLTESAVREIRHSDLKQISKPASNEIKNAGSRENCSGKSKTSAQYHIAQERADVIARKLDKTQKGLQNGRKLVEKHNGRSLQGLSSQIKASSTQSKKLENQSNPKKIQSNRSSITHNYEVARSRKSASESSVDQTPRIGTKNGKIQRRSSTGNPVAKKKMQKVDEKRADTTEEFHNNSIGVHMPDELVQKLGPDETKDSAKDYIENDGKSLFEAGGVTDLCGVSFASKKEQNHNADKIMVRTSSEMHQRHLLLSSPMFLNRVEKLFNLKMEKQPELLPSSPVGKGGIDNTRILLDCADELLERKSHQIAHLSHPMLHPRLRCKHKIPLDHLMDEVIDGIETWRCYSTSDMDSCRTDNLYLILGKDLMCKSMVLNGVWDMGWLNDISIEEAEQVIYEVENDVTWELIEEIVNDLARGFHYCLHVYAFR